MSELKLRPPKRRQFFFWQWRMAGAWWMVGRLCRKRVANGELRVAGGRWIGRSEFGAGRVEEFAGQGDFSAGIEFAEAPELVVGYSSGGKGVQENAAAAWLHVYAQGLAQGGAGVEDYVIGQIFHGRVAGYLQHGVNFRSGAAGAIDARCGRRRKARGGIFADADFDAEAVAAKDSSCGIQEQEIRGAVVERQGREDLQRQRVAAVAQHRDVIIDAVFDMTPGVICGVRPRAPLERQAQEAIAAAAARIQRAGRGGSS